VRAGDFIFMMWLRERKDFAGAAITKGIGAAGTASP
jgi:hypothetical protein